MTSRPCGPTMEAARARPAAASAICPGRRTRVSMTWAIRSVNIAGPRGPGPPPRRRASRTHPCRLSGREEEVQARPVLGDVHHRAAEHARPVVAAGVDAQGPADLLRRPGLVDVAVQPDRRLVALDGLPHRVAADR